MEVSQVEAQPALFDYGALPNETRAELEECRDVIRQWEQRTAEGIITIGERLYRAREVLVSDELFGRWREAEFGWTNRTALRFMNSYQVFGGMVMDKFSITIQPSAMYALSAGSCPEVIREEFIERAEDGEFIRHKDVVNAIEQWKLERDIAALRDGASLPESRYRVLYVDPPWRYNDQLVEGYGAAEHHYPTMDLDQLRTFFDDRGRSAAQITTDNSVMFMWATSPLLHDALELINAWGFTYKTSFVWDKVKHNYGHYNSVRHELLLVSTRGSCVPDTKKLFDSVQVIERTEKHSEKPEEFRAIIDTLYPPPEGRVDRLELFRRGASPDRWHVWGNEVANA